MGEMSEVDEEDNLRRGYGSRPIVMGLSEVVKKVGRGEERGLGTVRVKGEHESRGGLH